VGLALVIAVPVIAVDALLWIALRRVFRDQPERVRLVDAYVPWGTVLIATVLFAFVAWPLAVGFVAVAALFAVFGRRMNLPFGFPIYSGLRRR
jgi:hypothetical protein